MLLIDTGELEFGRLIFGYYRISDKFSRIQILLTSHNDTKFTRKKATFTETTSVETIVFHALKAETHYATNSWDTWRRQVAPSLRQVTSPALLLRQVGKRGNVSWFSNLTLNGFLRDHGKTIGPLHDPVTWYKIKYTGEQVLQWDFKNNAIRTSPPGPVFVLDRAKGLLTLLHWSHEFKLVRIRATYRSDQISASSLVAAAVQTRRDAPMCRSGLSYSVSQTLRFYKNKHQFLCISTSASIRARS